MTTENTGSVGGADDLDLFEAEATGQPVTRSTTVPEKFKGKTVEDMIQIALNAEKKISEQGKEVGTLRRMADEILQLKARPNTTTQKTEIEKHLPITVDALLNDPEKALRGAVDSSELAKRAMAAEERVARLEARITETEFVSKHKSFAEDLENPDFKVWVAKNEVRQVLGQAAANQNFTAAKNLWDMWEEHKELTSAVPHSESTKSVNKRVPGTVKAGPGENTSSEKIYSRAKLMALNMKALDGDQASLARWNDPVFQENRMRAYAEGRVK